MPTVKTTRGIGPRVGIERKYAQGVFGLMRESFLVPAREALAGLYDPQGYMRDLAVIEAQIKDDPNYGQEEASRAIATIEKQQRKEFNGILKTVSVGTALMTLFGRGGVGGPSEDDLLRSFMNQAIRRNVDLITDGTLVQVDRMKAFVGEQVTANPFDLSAQQNSIEGYLRKNGAAEQAAKNKAKLITRDQNNKLVGDLNRYQHGKVGGNKYEWDDAGDDRVRPNHASKHGQTFEWGQPPADTGHPGEDIQCRCVARFIFDLTGAAA